MLQLSVYSASSYTPRAGELFRLFAALHRDESALYALVHGVVSDRTLVEFPHPKTYAVSCELTERGAYIRHAHRVVCCYLYTGETWKRNAA